MKKFILITTLLINAYSFAQNVNMKKGFAAEGYDVVSYFNNEPLKGEEAFMTTHKGVKYKFADRANLATFKDDPETFIPQYGGYCAYAIATEGKKVEVNPKTFQIQDGKLYLFYDTIFADTLKKWNEEDPKMLQQKADENWEKITMKKK